MAALWYWGFRNPALLIAGLCASTGALAITEWGLALMGAAFFATIAYVADHLGRRAKQRAQRRSHVAAAMQEVALMRGRFSKQKEPARRRAA